MLKYENIKSLENLSFLCLCTVDSHWCKFMLEIVGEKLGNENLEKFKTKF